tara:strand:+ start:6620 stop:7159 length:540 start_codon:yes stop_codon:yes gene_type:complete
MANQENRTLDVLSQKLLLETGSEDIANPGKAAYIMQSMTEDGIKYNQSLHEGSGLSRQYAEKTLQVECGVNNKDSEKSYECLAHHGNISLDAPKGHVLISGRQITLDAEEIVIQGSKVRIGYNKMGQTSSVRIIGQSVEVTTKGGNIGRLLKTSSIFSAFSGSQVMNDLAQSLSGMYGV